MNYDDIIKACSKAGISVTELCERAGVPRITLYRYRIRLPESVVIYNKIKREVERLTPRENAKDND